MEKTIALLTLVAYFLLGFNLTFCQTTISISVDSVVLSNGKILSGTTRLVTQPLDPYILFNDSTIYKLKNIRGFKNKKDSYITMQHSKKVDNRTINRTLLLKQVVDGEIKIYSETTSLLKSSQPSFDYFSKLNGLPNEFNYDNLAVALADKPESYKRLKNARTLLHLGIGLILTGSVLTVYGLAKSVKASDTATNPRTGETTGGFRLTKITVIGGGIVLVGSIPIFLIKNKLVNAVRHYNKN